MAENYTQFSVMLPLPDGDVKAFLDRWGDESTEVEEDPELSDGWWGEYGGFSYEHRPTEGIWVHDEDGNGNPEAAAGFIQRYLKDFGIKEAVYMSWANTCSKPRINEFDGGGVVITQEEMFWVSSADAINRATEAGVDTSGL